MSNSVNLSLDVTKSGIQNPLIKVRQGDGGFETLHTTVTSNGEPLDLQGWKITFMGTTAGNHKIVDGNVNIVEAPNGIFDYTPSKAWGMDIGEFKIAYFKFVKGDGSASSANFRVNVIEAVDLTQEEAKNYISVVDTTIAEINQHLTDSLANVTKSIADANNNANTVASNVNSLGNRVDDYNNKLAAVKVGGRNYILNSQLLTITNLYTGGGATVGIVPFDSKTNMWHITAPQGGGIITGLFFPEASNVSTIIPNGVKWAFSVDVKGTGVYSNIGIDASSQVSKPVGKVSSDWTRISSTGTAGYRAVVIVYFDTTNSPLDVYVKLPKLEIGNVPTDWTPAPEDVPSNDAQLVHKTGTETIAGDKTFTGNTNFSGSITAPQVTATDLLNGFHNVIQVPDTTTSIIDLINNDFIKGRGFWKEATFIALNRVLSDAPTNDAYSIVKLATRGSNRTYVEYSDLSGNIWHTTASTNTLGTWVKQANDAEVVHKTGTETIAGDKTFTGASTLTNVKSSSVKTGIATLNGLTINFRQTVVGVNVFIDGSFQGDFGTSNAYIDNSNGVPSTIDKPRQSVVLIIIGNGGVGGTTTNAPFKLEVLIGTDGTIKYRAKNLRENDTTSRNSTIVGAASTFYSLD